MLKWKLNLIIFGLMIASTSWCQCPDGKLLWQRLTFLRDSIEISPDEELSELLNYANKLKNCEYKYDSTHALLEQRIGIMYYYKNDFLSALSHIKQSISIINSNTGKPTINEKFLSRLYFNLSVIYDSLNRVTERMDAIDSCVGIAFRTRTVDEYSLYLLSKRVEYLVDIGDYQRGINFADIAEAITRQYVRGKDSIEYILKFLSWKVTALISSREYSLAEKLLTNKIEECKYMGANQYLGTIYGQIAIVQAEKGLFDKAYNSFQEAIKWHKNSRDSLGCQQTLTNLAFLIYAGHLHDSRRAIRTYQKALNYIGKNVSRDRAYAIEALNIYANIANALVYEKKFDSAFLYFQLAFDQIDTGTNETALLNSSLEEFVQNKKITILISLLIDKANAYTQKYKNSGKISDVHEAVRIYKVTDRLLTRMKSDHSELQSKLMWRRISRKLYENAIEASYSYDNIADAFYFFEKSRAVLLNDQILEQKLLKDDEFRKVALLRKRILSAVRKNEERSDLSSIDIQKARFSSQEELNLLVKGIKDKNPIYYQNFLDTNFLSIREVQTSVLKEHIALIEIFTGENAVYSLIITHEQADLKRIDKNVFDSTINQFLSYLSNSDRLNKEFDSFVSISRQVYLLFFQNIKLPPGRIIISPDKYLFPFEAIVTGIDPIKYLVNDYAVSYTYSAKYLMNYYDSRSNPVSSGILGVAPINYPNSMGLASLNGSDRSLERIVLNFRNAETFLEGEASKGNFMQHFAHYKIVQLYTHASDSSVIGEPVIYFADSALYFSDLISENRPNTDLVILSACETGLGRFYEGEGVFSFNRGFAAMGIPSSITNVWEVENESTYRLTELFYKYLASEVPYDLSLQKAKIEFIETASREKTLPSFWAAPILFGKPNQIHFRTPTVWRSYGLLLAFGGLLLTGLVIFLRFAPRSKRN